MSCVTVKTATRGLLTFAIVFCTIWGSAEAQNRIVGGFETTIEEFPFQLALEGGGRHICGGSILTRDWALTAAHCVYDQPVRWLAFRSGTSTREKGGTVHPVKYYVYHDLYRRGTLDYDVAVVYVRVPFDFKVSTMPVLLPKTVLRRRELVTVAGWGYLEQQQLRKPKELMASAIYTFPWEECKKIYPGVTPRMLCAGDAVRDICNGDSGGPLVKDSRHQVGIVSWGYKCADGLPSVYTNISSVAPWIISAAGLDNDIVFPDK